MKETHLPAPNMQTKKRRLLDEVTLMRTILTFLIVFMHAFTCYNGSWAEPKGYIPIPLYKWLTRISFAFTLESFVFISGYIYAFQRITLNRKSNLATTIKAKFKRLYLPSIIFSIIYFALFYTYSGIGSCLYSIVNGCGHMWFLPMLFWCFIGCWILINIRCNEVLKFIILLILNLCTIIHLPLQISSAFKFLFYFYSGYIIYQYRDSFISWINKSKLIWIWAIATITFAIFRPLRDILIINGDAGVISKVLINTANNACTLVYASTGLLAFYLTTLLYTKQHSITNGTIQLASCCFGVYLFQQFILKYLYYQTTLPTTIGPYWLPWCGFVITIILSILLSSLLLNTKIGRFLIG